MTSTTDKVELLPCPFCGCQPDIVGRFDITCTNCGVTVNSQSPEKQWNTRAQHVQSVDARAAAEEIAELYVDDPTTIDREVLAKHMGNIEAIIAKHVQPVFVTCDYRKPECVNDGALVDGVWRCNNHLTGRVSDTLSNGGRAAANPEHESDKPMASVALHGPSLTDAIEAVRDCRKWYDESIFTPTTIEETQAVHKQFDGMVDLISAQAARHVIDKLVEQLQSLQGKAPVGESRLCGICLAAGRVYCPPEHTAATTPSSGDVVVYDSDKGGVQGGSIEVHDNQAYSVFKVEHPSPRVCVKCNHAEHWSSNHHHRCAFLYTSIDGGSTCSCKCVFPESESNRSS